MAEFRALLFAPFSSVVDTGFWHELSRRKLDVYALDDKPKPLNGSYANRDPAGLPSRLSVDYDAFERLPSGCNCVSHGTLLNMNTPDAFKSADKSQLLNDAGKRIWESITSGDAVKNPGVLNQFLLLSFADLKKYHFLYWFAFPALCPEEPIVANEAQSLDSVLSVPQMGLLQSGWDTLCTTNDQNFFLVSYESDSDVRVAPLRDWEAFTKDHSRFFVGFSDPCTLEKNPGWPLRNYLVLLAHIWKGKFDSIDVLCYRDRTLQGVRSSSHSLVLKVKLPTLPSDGNLKCVGWEKNKKQKLGPRIVDLSSSMDPSRLAESAVDLNLKLMRWRIIPNIDLDLVAGTKCLLLGSGTLGCNVARCLMGWGVRTITLVDNSRVSYSNPVRQSLFVFDDCVEGGKPKGQAAAEALQKIFPGINASGLTLSIPMPGHSVSSAEGEMERVKKSVKKLEELIDAHDAIFLLMDTRESRWLPTVIASAKRKLVINCALGFDTFLVMRHGVRADSAEKASASGGESRIPGSDLGCYFCNDVVAPGDSTKDRTLDQQCTVSRPGMSMMAGALAVELLVSVLQHPQKGAACGDTTAREAHLEAEFESALGLVPHQIRGFLSRFYSVMPASLAFDKCTACSELILSKYLNDGFDFLLKAFNSPTFLEELTGLDRLLADTVDDEIWALSDEEDSDVN
ncbi:ubiquitin-like modifier-activating enzyme ATG7 [Oscarella lobularis]|uniref:ubiquitin-like modifier-activating enzyme ATG7 n=1 Tax=Oscarella lobularis TaxID=121494 RepID=UPI0033137C31